MKGVGLADVKMLKKVATGGERSKRERENAWKLRLNRVEESTKATECNRWLGEWKGIGRRCVRAWCAPSCARATQTETGIESARAEQKTKRRYGERGASPSSPTVSFSVVESRESSWQFGRARSNRALIHICAIRKQFVQQGQRHHREREAAPFSVISNNEDRRLSYRARRCQKMAPRWLTHAISLQSAGIPAWPSLHISSRPFNTKHNLSSPTLNLARDRPSSRSPQTRSVTKSNSEREKERERGSDKQERSRDKQVRHRLFCCSGRVGGQLQVISECWTRRFNR